MSPDKPLMLMLNHLNPVPELMTVLVVQLVLQQSVLLLHVMRTQRRGHSLISDSRLLRGHRSSKWNKGVFIEVKRGRR